MAQEGGEQKDGAPGSAGVVGFKPQLVVPGMKAEAAVQFYKAAFGAAENRRMVHPKRKADQEIPLIIAAELLFGSSPLIVSDLLDDDVDAGKEGAAAAIGVGIAFRVETEDVEAVMKKAVEAGAEAVGEVKVDEGGALGKVKDPFGVVWVIASVAKKATDANAEA